MTEERILARIAELFYIYGISQYDIAKKFNFSKAKVCRLIKEAKAKNIIEFNIKKYDKRLIGLERQMESSFGLKEAVIYQNLNIKRMGKDYLFEEIGAMGARYIERILKDNISIAIGPGKTIYHIIKNVEVKKKKKINIFSTLGGITLTKAEYQNNDLVQMLADKIGGTSHPIYLPLIFEKEEFKSQLLKDEYVNNSLKKPSKINYYIAGVGPSNKKSRYYTLGYFDSEFIQKLEEKGICGEIGLNFYDIDGNFVSTGMENRIINLNIEDIKKTQNKIITAFGDDKVIPLKGLLKTNIPDVLITDSKTAQAILK